MAVSPVGHSEPESRCNRDEGEESLHVALKERVIPRSTPAPTNRRGEVPSPAPITDRKTRGQPQPPSPCHSEPEPQRRRGISPSPGRDAAPRRHRIRRNKVGAIRESPLPHRPNDNSQRPPPPLCHSEPAGEESLRCQGVTSRRTAIASADKP
jgi:hypothetical protein